MNKIMISETSDLVFPYDRYGKTGRVHSIFSNSLNLIVKNQLIHISGSKDFLSSFGIRISEHDFQEFKKFVEVGNLVSFKESSFAVYGFSQVNMLIGSLLTTSVVKQEISKVSYSSENIRKLLNHVSSFVNYQVLGIPDDMKFRQIKASLTSIPFNEDEVNYAMRFLIGRGLGLTPSGDDILLGYAFGLTVFTDVPIITQMKKISKYWTDLTTNISKAYLDSFIVKRVSSPIFRLNQALRTEIFDQIDKAIQEVRDVGHTSGIDFIYGFLLSLHYITQNNEMRG